VGRQFLNAITVFIVLMLASFIVGSISINKPPDKFRFICYKENKTVFSGALEAGYFHLQNKQLILCRDKKCTVGKVIIVESCVYSTIGMF
jgi:hypothetical protein